MQIKWGFLPLSENIRALALLRVRTAFRISVRVRVSEAVSAALSVFPFAY